ncbi:MAG: hypothetical protein ACFFAK_17720, partial [Promethearchaeota archaeon]
KTYSLDFNTETKNVGFYTIYVNLKKDNYEARAAHINLEIKLREFYANWDATGREGNQINVVQGNNIFIEINLTDQTRNNIPLEDASVILMVRGVEYRFNNITSGYYTLTFNTENFDAFFAAETFPGQIIIQKDNFTTQELNLIFNIKMVEIFPGMPTFYFILITASIAGILIAVISYRVIQQARIPKFIKKIRKVKGYIKTKKAVTESLSIPSKEKMLIKLFGEDWKEIGLSLDDVLGVEALKSRTFQLKNKLTKKGGETE